jgi:hypothetical protein
MLYNGQMCSYNFKYNNWGTNPSATPGTSVIPGAADAEGAWTQIISGASITSDCYWLHLFTSGGATATAIKRQLLDLGIDPAGGTAYTSFFSNLQIGASPSLVQVGVREYIFPIFIRAGSSVAVRIQGSNATAGTVRVAASIYGKPSNQLLAPVGSFSQTFGTLGANSQGQSFTPGNAADGSWADLGVVTNSLWWFQLGHNIGNGTVTAEYTYIDVAWGDASNKHLIFKAMHGGSTNETSALYCQSHLLGCSAYSPVPAGANIYIRGRCNNAPDNGYNATVVGIGG